MISLYNRLVAVTIILLLLSSLLISASQESTSSNRSVKGKDRIALVIGNTKYSIAPLKNPVNDANAIERVLRDFGFQVEIILDADSREMVRAVDRFIKKLHPDSVGLFYYAGHGMQIEDVNYLLPTDFAPKDEEDAKKDSYSASLLSQRMVEAKARVSILILDACRNNPFRTMLSNRSRSPITRAQESAKRGLAEMVSGTGTFIAFATAPGDVASENLGGPNGLFTYHLLEALKGPLLCLNDVFDKTRQKVYLASNGKQQPWIASSLLDKFCFTDPDSENNLCPCSQSSTCFGRLPGNSESFSVDTNYEPSGMLGDIGDLTISKIENSCRFKYTTNGRGPHEWDYKYKYIDNQRELALNPEPAQFAGVTYLDPPNNFGTVCGGYDLRGFRRLKWEARSLQGEVLVEFIIGGINWIWDEQNKRKITPPYPDTMPRVSLGTRRLSAGFQTFEFDLSNRPEASLARLVAGFSWVISWGSNNVELNDERTGPKKTRTFEIEIKNIRYER